jgi:hypothetical protein
MTLKDSVRLSEITVGELKGLLREIVEDVVQVAFFELEQQLPDPDVGLELKSEIHERLKQSLQQNGELRTIEDVQRELDLDG